MRAILRSGVAVAAIVLGAGPLFAQDGPAPRPDNVAAMLAATDADAEGLFSDTELDVLLAPYALYPDVLLTQILIAATYPLDLVRAQRWIADNVEMAPEARTAATEGEGWDPSVAVVAAGFPAVVERMAADLDATEALGDAVLAQTDDVLGSVQRLRGQAQAAGALETNAAQTVIEEAGSISIAPTDPDVVYVPRYDPNVVYAAPPGYYPPAPVYDSAYGTNDLLVTGALAFGGALLLSEIFDDDDDWNGYWRSNNNHIDWDDDAIFSRPDREINIDGDVNIDRDRWDIDRTKIDRDRLGGLDPDRARPGQAWKPDPDKRSAVKAKLKARPAFDGARRTRAEAGAEAALGGAAVVHGGGEGGARAKIEASAKRRESAPRAAKARDVAFKPKAAGGQKVKAERDRGAASVSRDRPKADRPKAVGKPKQAKAPQRKAAQKGSAFKKPKGGGSKAKAASLRGKKSKGGGKRR